MYDAKTEVSVPPPPRAAARAAPRRRPDARTHSLLLTKAQMVPRDRSISSESPPNRRRATLAISATSSKAARRRSSPRASAAGSPTRSSTPAAAAAPQASSGGKATKTPAAAREASHPDSESGRDSFRGHKGEVGSMPRNLELPSSAAQPRWAGTCATGRSRRAASSKIAARKSSSQVIRNNFESRHIHVYAPRALMGRGGARAGCAAQTMPAPTSDAFDQVASAAEPTTPDSMPPSLLPRWMRK